MWYYTLQGQQFGPFDEAAMRALLASGTVGINTLVWTEGMADWVKLSQSSLANGMRLPPATPPQAPIQQSVQAGGSERKDRVAYVLLAVLLGLGVHNFYAGHKRNGLIQLLCVVLSCGLLWLPIWIWSVVEACTVTSDSDGQPFK